MSHYLSGLQRCRRRLKSWRAPGGIIVEAIFLIPIVIVIFSGLVALQQSFEDQHNLQIVLEQSALETSNTLDMLIVLTSKLTEYDELARESVAWLTGGGFSKEQRDLLESGYFKEAMLQAYYQSVFLLKCRQMGILASSQIIPEKDGFVVLAQLAGNAGPLKHMSIHQPAIRLRVLNEGLQAFLATGEAQGTTVYLTPNGINETGCFHTHYCWSLVRAKKVIPVAITKIPEGFPFVWHWQGKSYRLCGFCHQERWTEHDDD